jgi:hypothetical protein
MEKSDRFISRYVFLNEALAALELFLDKRDS